MHCGREVSWAEHCPSMSYPERKVQSTSHLQGWTVTLETRRQASWHRLTLAPPTGTSTMKKRGGSRGQRASRGEGQLQGRHSFGYIRRSLQKTVQIFLSGMPLKDQESQQDGGMRKGGIILHRGIIPYLHVKSCIMPPELDVLPVYLCVCVSVCPSL
jgi:hypothetical protein